jgi:4-amino-4-deoxy-L-arabinose transferase-like glycosyltransferase
MTQRAHKILFFIVAMAFALRVVAGAVLPDQSAILGDAIAYRQAGQAFWETGQLGTPYYMPLYPVTIASLGPGWPQMLADIILSTVSVWLIYLLANVMFDDKRVALLAAATAAIYPYLIFYAVVGLSETLFITLVLAAYACWYRDQNVGAAVFAVLAILTRPVFDLVAPVLVVVFAVVVHRQTVRIALRNLLMYAAVYCAMMSPWWLHNYNAYGSFVRLNTGAGLALFSANNPSNQGGGFDINLGVSAAPFDRIANPVERDHAMRDAAFAYMKSDLGRTLWQAVLRFERFWRPWAHAETYSSPLYVLLSVASFAPVLLMAIMFCLLRGISDFRRIAPPLVFIGCLTLVHMVFPGSLRYRLPVEPFLMILAAAGIVDLAKRFRILRPAQQASP